MNTTFSIGNVLGTGFKIWLKNFAPFMLLTALIYTPLWIWGLTSVHGEMTFEKLEAASNAVTYQIPLVLLLNVFVAAALTYGVVMELHGQRASLGSCVATGLTRFLPALGAALLSMLCIAGASVLLLVPGIIVTCMLYVAMPAAVLERPGVLDALGRSRTLTDGHKFEIFGLVFLFFLLNLGVAEAVQALTLPHAADPEYIDETMRSFPTFMYAHLVSEMMLGSLSATMTAVAYFFLRSEKEGTSVHELARIFD